MSGNENSPKQYYMNKCVDLDANYMIEICLPSDIGLPAMTMIIEVLREQLNIWQMGATEITGIFFIEPDGKGVRAAGLIKAVGLSFDLLTTQSKSIFERIWVEGTIECREVMFPSGLLYYCTKGIDDDDYDTDRIVLLN